MMQKKLSILKCEDTGLTVELLGDKSCCEDKDCQIECCGKPMVLQTEKTSAQEGNEKHVPVVHEGREGVKVVVGSVNHPMEEDHYIEWIEVINGDYVNRKHLHPGDAPEAEFYVPMQDGLIIRSYCNKHGLWRG